MLCVDPIHRSEVTYAREKHPGAHNIIEILAGRLENRRKVLEDALRLGHNTPLDNLAGGRVLADLTAEVEETTDVDSLGKRASRRRELGRGNCRFAHSKLLCGYWVTIHFKIISRINSVPRTFLYSLRSTLFLF